MFRFADPENGSAKSDTTEQMTRLLRSHWQDIRGPRVMPRRGEIVPQDITAALPWLFTAEPVAPGVLRIRHAGRALSDMLRMEPRGMPICAFLTPEGRAGLRPLIASAQQRPAMIEAGLIAGSGIILPAVAARLLLLPLSDNGIRPDSFIGLLTGEQRARRPLRFDLDAEALRCTPLRSEATMPRLVATGGKRNAGPDPRPALQLVVSNG